MFTWSGNTFRLVNLKLCAIHRSPISFQPLVTVNPHFVSMNLTVLAPPPIQVELHRINLL